MKDRILKKLEEFAQTDFNKSFQTMTTLRIGGNAKYVVYPENEVALDAILRIIDEEKLAYKIIGKGSDLLCSDDDFDGVIIRLDKHYNDAYFDDETIMAQAGCSIIALAHDAMKHGLTGLEFACGIPGTVGGAIFMNAGAYKASMADIVKEVLVYANGKSEWIKGSHCKFGYRSSIFQERPDWIILGARLQLKQGNIHEISDLMDSRKKRRMESQPLEYPSCGSVFRNPEGMNAWALIEGIGYRGKRIGDAYVSDKHCNFIVNLGNATAKDYCELIQEIKDKVKEKYDVELHTEVERFNWK